MDGEQRALSPAVEGAAEAAPVGAVAAEASLVAAVGYREGAAASAALAATWAPDRASLAAAAHHLRYRGDLSDRRDR